MISWPWKSIFSKCGCLTILQENVESCICNRTLYLNTTYCYSSNTNQVKSKRFDINKVPNIKDFLKSEEVTDLSINSPIKKTCPPYLENAKYLSPPNGKTVYFETYGCQMNVNDAEYAWAILQNAGYKRVDAFENVSSLKNLRLNGHISFEFQTRIYITCFGHICNHPYGQENHI